MMTKLSILIPVLLALRTSLVFGVEVGADTANVERLLWGRCELYVDPENEVVSQWPKICFHAHLTQQATLRSERHESNREFQFGRAYAGFYLNRHLSLHLKGKAHRFSKPLTKAEYVTENAYVQLGNVALHRFRLAVGILDLPFGINSRPLLEVYDEVYKTNKFWSLYRHGARIAYEDLRNTEIDIGVATDQTFFERLEGEKLEEDARPVVQWSARIMVDIPALNGTRFVFSLFEEAPREKRISGGILTKDFNNGTTSFEWVRRYLDPRPQGAPFEQLMRLTYVGDRRLVHNWVFEYEDELQKHWLTTLGYEHRFWRHGRMRLNVSYLRSRNDFEVNHWIFGSGVQFKI